MTDIEKADNLIWQLKEAYPDSIFDVASLNPMIIHHNSTKLQNDDDFISFMLKTMEKDMNVTLEYNSLLR